MNTILEWHRKIDLLTKIGFEITNLDHTGFFQFWEWTFRTGYFNIEGFGFMGSRMECSRFARFWVDQFQIPGLVSWFSSFYNLTFHKVSDLGLKVSGRCLEIVAFLLQIVTFGIVGFKVCYFFAILITTVIEVIYWLGILDFFFRNIYVNKVLDFLTEIGEMWETARNINLLIFKGVFERRK